MVRPVGDVVVNVQVGLQGGDQPRHGLGLGAGEAQEIAVEVDAVCGGAVAHPVDRTVLVGSVVGGDVFVAVGVVNRGEDGDRRLGEIRPSSESDVAQDHQRRDLAVHFAGMNAALDEQDRFAGGLHLGGAESAIRRNNHQREENIRAPTCRRSKRGWSRAPPRRFSPGTLPSRPGSTWP